MSYLLKWYEILEIDGEDKEEQSIAWNAEDTY
jgi:hypothetical protein